MKARAPIEGRVVKTNAWRKVVRVFTASSLEERKDKRVQLVCTTEVFDVGIELVAQAEIQAQSTSYTPVVMEKRCEVSIVCIRQYERPLGKAAAKRHCKKQIVVVNAAVAVAIEIRKVFDQLDAALLKHLQIEIRLDTLNLAADREGVIATDHGEGVAKLVPPLFRLLWHAERRAVLNARKRKLWSRRNGQRVVKEGAKTEVETVYVVRREKARVICEQ